MARKRKGRDLHGWLVVDKPAGITSTSVVNKVKWALDAKKAGHAGTLDPDATGVLAVALGEATKTVPYITDALKAYTFTVRLGQKTNTDDAEGEVTAQSDIRPTDDEIKAQLGQFVGDIMQTPPLFSAVKIDGERAYKRARDGEEFEIAARPLWVEELLLVARPDADHVTLEMTCGKGGYVRAIARDLGDALGCFGHVRDLRRTWSGPFVAEDGVTLAQLDDHAKTDGLDHLILPLEAGLEDLPRVHCPEASITKLRNGNPALVMGDVEYGDECWAAHGETAIAVGIFKAGELHPTRVLCGRKDALVPVRDDGAQEQSIAVKIGPEEQHMVDRETISTNEEAHIRHDPGGKVHIRLPDGIIGGATFSACGRYRYTLTRDWTPIGAAPRTIMFVGQNPSVARAEVSDPTCDKEVRFAKLWGFTRYIKTNMLDWRATNPKDVPHDSTLACSAQNLPAILREAAQVDEILMAYGKLHKRHAEVVDQMISALQKTGKPLNCLKLNKDGSAQHPLYIRGDTQRFPFREAQ